MTHLIGLRNTQKDQIFSNFHDQNNVSKKNKNNDSYPISVDERNGNSLNVFLRKSSLLCELIMNEQSNLKNEKKKELNQNRAGDGKIFNFNVVTLGVKNKMAEEKEREMVTNYVFDDYDYDYDDYYYYCYYHYNCSHFYYI